MFENYLDWLKGAEENLEVVDILFKHQKYRFAIFNLQQAGEITSKALLMKANLLLSFEESALVRDLRKDFCIPTMSAKDYRHDWHFKLIKIIDGFINSLDRRSEEIISSKIFEERIISNFSEFRDNVPDYRARIEAAKALRLDVNPQIQELNDTILICHHLLNQAFKSSRTFKSKFRMPSKTKLISKIESRLNVKLDESTLNVVDRLWAININDFSRRIIVLSQTLVVLAVVNSYLLPHEQKSRYPFGAVGVPYDSSMPLVTRINDFGDVVRSCIFVGQGRQGLTYDRNISEVQEFGLPDKTHR